MIGFTKRNFGIELESHPVLDSGVIVGVIKNNSSKKVIVTGWKQTHNNNHWHLKTDSTCGGGEKNGWEVVSYKGSGLDDVLHIANVASALGEAGLKCGNDCGFHVHVDMSDFTPDMAAVLLAIWTKVERLMLEAVPRHRSYNRHCKPIRNKIHPKGKVFDPSEFWNLFSPKNFSIHSNRDKKVTMNLVNYATCLAYSQKTISENFYCDSSRKTVEFRFPEGTFSFVDIRNWIFLFVQFVEGSKSKQMPENLYSVRSVDEFCSLLSLSDCEVKNWLFNRILLNSDSKKWKNCFQKRFCDTK